MKHTTLNRRTVGLRLLEGSTLHDSNGRYWMSDADSKCIYNVRPETFRILYYNHTLEVVQEKIWATWYHREYKMAEYMRKMVEDICKTY